MRITRRSALAIGAAFAGPAHAVASVLVVEFR